MPADTARLFLALWPDPALRESLLDRRGLWTWPPGAALTLPDNLHLTLHFLGAIPRSRLAELSERMDVAFEPFDLILDQATLWQNGAAVIEPAHVPTALTRLHTTLGEALLRLGLPLETRPFRPHVTLARRAAGAAAPSTSPPLVWRATGYALLESPKDRAERYRIVASWP